MKVLFVCTGNICRSPTAEGIFRHRIEALGLAGRIIADSAGISSEESGNPPDPRACRAARACGYVLPQRYARRIRKTDFEQFDLILAMDRGHQAALLRLAPPGRRDRVRLFLDYAPALGLRDVPDPWYGDAQHFDHALDLIEAGVDGLIAALTTASGAAVAAVPGSAAGSAP